jgi:hypothetical protein
MTFHDASAFQQAMFQAYVSNLVALAIVPLLAAQEILRAREEQTSAEPDATPRTANIVPITSHSFKTRRHRKGRAGTGVVLYYGAFVWRLRRGIARMTSTGSEQ